MESARANELVAAVRRASLVHLGEDGPPDLDRLVESIAARLEGARSAVSASVFGASSRLLGGYAQLRSALFGQVMTQMGRPLERGEIESLNLAIDAVVAEQLAGYLAE